MKEESRIRQLVKLWDDSLVKGDTAFVANILSDDFVFVSSDGTMRSKSELLEAIKRGGVPLASESKISSLRIYGDVAVVVAEGSTTRQEGTREITDRYRFSDVWVRKGGSWKAVLTQITPKTKTEAHP